MYFLISARAHPIDNVFIRLCGLVPIYILGLGAPESVRGTLIATLVMLVVTVWGFFIHANMRWRLGPLEWLITTPGFHHWHHTLLGAAGPQLRFDAALDGLALRHLSSAARQWPAAYGIETKLPASLAGQLLYPLRDPAAEEQAPTEPARVNRS